MCGQNILGFRVSALSFFVTVQTNPFPRHVLQRIYTVVNKDTMESEKSNRTLLNNFDT